MNARVRYNSQLGTPYYNIRFADMTGDGIHGIFLLLPSPPTFISVVCCSSDIDILITEFLLFRNEKVYVTTSEYAANGLMYLRLPGAASRIIHGNSLTTLRCFVIVSFPHVAQQESFPIAPKR